MAAIPPPGVRPLWLPSTPDLTNNMHNATVSSVKEWLQIESNPNYKELLAAAVFENRIDIFELLLHEEKKDGVDTAHHQKLILDELFLRTLSDRSPDWLRILLQYTSQDILFSVLQAIVSTGLPNDLKTLLAAGVDINMNGGEIIDEIIQQQKTLMLTCALQHGADLSEKSENSALFSAIGLCSFHPASTRMLQLLLTQKPYLEFQNQAGQTALHLAAEIAVETDNITPFELLWCAGADLHAIDNRNITPLDILRKAQPYVLRDLQHHGLNLGNPQSGSPIVVTQPQKVSSFFVRKDSKELQDEASGSNRCADVDEKIQYASQFDFGLAVIEAIRKDDFLAFLNLHNEPKYTLWNEHRRIAIDIAATVNPTWYVKRLLPADSKESAYCRGIALVSALKAGHVAFAESLLTNQILSDPAASPVISEEHVEGPLLPITEQFAGMALKHLVQTKNWNWPLIETLLNNGYAVQPEILGALLCEATEQNQVHIVQLLLKNCNGILDPDKQKASERAETLGFSEIAQSIQQSRMPYPILKLTTAAANGDLATLDKLLDAASPSGLGVALIRAAERGQVNAVRKILQRESLILEADKNIAIIRSDWIREKMKQGEPHPFGEIIRLITQTKKYRTIKS